MLKCLAPAVVALGIATAASAAPFEAFWPDIWAQLPDNLRAEIAPMDFQQGEILLGGGIAALSVPEGYYFLDPADSKRMLEGLWGNLEQSPPLGIVMPRDLSPLHEEAWAAILDFEAVGYVEDKDAADTDFDAVLDQSKADAEAESVERERLGMEPVRLIGWAEAPHYDPENRTLYWAKDLLFGTSEAHSLNYYARILGRKGVLQMNFVAGMDQLDAIKRAAPDVMAMATFTRGNSYLDFDPSVDEVAAYGIGGLIAAKVAAKVGFLGVALVFLKKFAFLIIIPLIWLKNKLFRRPEA